VNKTTGFILELEAQRLELGATNAARDALMTKPDASGVIVVVGRTDNILSTRLLHVSARIVPLAYPDTIGVSIGFLNPANNLVAV
jgi:hypothetical protein